MRYGILLQRLTYSSWMDFIYLFLHKNNHMFSKGQIIFAILFILVFAVVIGYTYRKDLKLHKKFYAGSLWVLLARSEEHTSELQSRENLVCRLLLEKK